MTRQEKDEAREERIHMEITRGTIKTEPYCNMVITQKELDQSGKEEMKDEQDVH